MGEENFIIKVYKSEEKYILNLEHNISWQKDAMGDPSAYNAFIISFF